MQSLPSYWHWVALATVIVWAAVFRVKTTLRTHVMAALVLAWVAALFSWSVSLDPAKGSVSGRVVSAKSRQPLAQARVYMPDGSAWVRTDGNGDFILRGVPVGKAQRITVRVRGYETAYDEVDVKESAETSGLLFRMTPRVPTFTLYNGQRVFLPGEKPQVNVSGALLTDFTVELYRLDPYRDRATVTDAARRQAASDRLAKGENTIYETHHNATLDPDGDFDGQITLPSQLNGLYFVRMISDEGSMVRTSWFMVTDLALVTRRSPHELLVYAQDFSTGKPVQGALLEFFDGKRSVRKAVTGADGTFVWKEPGPAALTVVGQQADSYAYSRTDGQSSGDAGEPYRVYLYTDRPIYRPGHEVHVRGIVRRDRERAYRIPEGETVRVRVDDARGTAVVERDVTVGAFGGFDLDLTLPARAPLGEYGVNATIGSTSGHAWFKVAEYRKPEFVVMLKTEKDHYRNGDPVRVRVDARYFFGAPVTPAKVRYSVYESWYHDDRAAFLDLDDGGETPEHYGGMVAEGDLRLDENGDATVEFTPGPSTHDRSFWVEVEVEDASHRTVDANTDVLVTLGDYRIDASTDRWGYAPGQAVNVAVTTRTFEGDKPRPSTAVHGLLTRIDYVEKTEKGLSTLERKAEPVWTSDGVTNSAGQLTFTLTPPTDGSYELRLTSKDERGSEISQTLWLFVAGDAATTRSYGSRDLTVLLDQSKYRPGGTARVVLTSRVPNASVLLCVDGRRIHSYRVVTLKGTSVTLDLPVEARYFPNVTISAVAIRNKELLTDEKPLVVDTADRGLRVEITPEKEVYEPAETVKARVRITDGQGHPVAAEFSLGVVDAAIYALAPDATEKIYEFFYGFEPSYVRTEYSFAPDYSGGRNKEDDPRVRRNFKDTAWWAPALHTDASGNADVSFALPDNITTWRFTVRAVDRQHRVGEATREIVARKPLLVRLEVPRFMVERDKMELSAVVHNETEKTQSVTVDMTAEGLRLDGGAQTAPMAPRSVRRFAWTVEAQAPGTAQVSVMAKGQGAGDAMALSFPVLPHGVARWQSAAGEALPTATWTPTVGDDTDASRARLTVYLSPSLAATAMQGLDYLASYPYGCVEQTMSAFVPDIVVSRALSELGMDDAALKQRLPDMIARGLDKIYDMQHIDGGWGWWKDDSTNPYVTAYVVNGLHLARRAGFDVRADVWKRAVAALKKLSTEDAGEFREASGEVRQRTVWNVKAYEACVLDRVGEDAHALALAVDRHQDHLGVHTQALLAQTLWRVGEKQRAEALLEKIRGRVDETETQAHWESKTLSSEWVDDPVETTSAVLAATLMIDPKSPQIDRIVRWLVAYRKGLGWTNTRDTAAAVDVLVDVLLARRVEMKASGSAAVRVNGRDVATVAIDGPLLGERGVVTVPASLLRVGANDVEVRRVGEGALYWSASLETFAKGEALAAEDHGLSLTRTYAVIETRKDEKGRVSSTPVPLGASAPVPLGARVRVAVTVKNKVPMNYVLIEDKLIPGCELVEDEASRNTRGPWWVGREVHDAQIAVFASRLEPGAHVLTYEVRAEAPGTYHVRPAESFLMYTPEVRGTSAESIFVVSGAEAKP